MVALLEDVLFSRKSPSRVGRHRGSAGRSSLDLLPSWKPWALRADCFELVLALQNQEHVTASTAGNYIPAIYERRNIGLRFFLGFGTATGRRAGSGRLGFRVTSLDTLSD